jgi:hypothetical protein
LALANWARENIPADERFGASIADARLLMDPGERLAFAGKHPDIQDLLLELAFSREGWEMPLLRKNGIRYIVTDSREIASDSTRGYPFSVGGEPIIEQQAILKFGELPGARRIYSNGEISVYDLGAHP